MIFLGVVLRCLGFSLGFLACFTLRWSCFFKTPQQLFRGNFGGFVVLISFVYSFSMFFCFHLLVGRME